VIEETVKEVVIDEDRAPQETVAHELLGAMEVVM